MPSLRPAAVAAVLAAALASPPPAAAGPAGAAPAASSTGTASSFLPAARTPAAPAAGAPGAVLDPLAAARERGESIGLYPLQLPPGEEALQERLAAQLHDGAAGLRGVRAFDLIPRGACLPDEGACLAAAARSAGLSQMASGSIEATARGYRFTLRLFTAAGGGLVERHDASVEGGPLDLAGALEHGVCTLLGAAPCAGSLAVRSDLGDHPSRLEVDGRDLGPLPLARPLSLPVGRHLVRVGAEERRVRVSYHRDTRLLCTLRAGSPALLDDQPDGAPLPAPPLALAAVPAGTGGALAPQPRVGRLLLAAGGALLASSLGLEWLARSQSASLDARYRAGQLTAADQPRYGQAQVAGTAALILAATGAGAVAAGGVVLLIVPSGAAVQGRF